jgi:acetyl esterase
MPDTAMTPTPLLADDLTGLSPVFLVVGGNDPVRDDLTDYGDKLRAGGVPNTLRLLPGVGHADLLRTRGQVLPAVVAALWELGLPESALTRL